MPLSAKRPQRGQRSSFSAKNHSSSLDVDFEGDLPSSPSRPAKRRKKAPAPTNDTRNNASQGTEDDQTVAQVTQHLKSHPVQASKDHSNAMHEANGDGVKAYAKVAAQDWTFYITKLAVNIGRAPETAHPTEDDEDEQIHIDLGPSKMVSRSHASIIFDSKDEKWLLQVNGRNGAKVDGQLLKSRACYPLTSGEVIEIGNVEMMFVLPSEISPLHVHPSFLQRSGVTSDAGSSAQKKSAAPPSYQRPGTPPYSERTSTMNTKSPATSTPAVMIGASGADLSLDDNQHIKPQYSYAQMITQAVMNAPEGKLNLNGIYNYIMSNYSYYRHQQAAGWQNSIRHNLSLNKSFDKVARSTDEPGKGMKWQIVADARDEMIRNAFKIGRGGHRGSSAPSSPNQLNYITHGPKDMATKESPTRKLRGSPLTSPPPRSSLNISTPSRSDRSLERSATLTADGSPLPRQKKTAEAPSAFSGFQPQSPTLTSSYLHEEGSSFITPAPPRVHPRLAPPSTAQRPSQHMPTSSPAPFWKYADIGSTPLKPPAPYEISPSKPGRGMPPPSSSPVQMGKSPPSSPSRPQLPSVSEQEGPGEVEEEQGFDLTKGFQSISAYHAPVGRGLAVGTALKGKM
ncbi:Putative Transcription factor, fork head [[Torrubiella] hemipterigena]|uniref:Putative Transcription factor, fork head n=1 Tax=[Torrubiella] hemipterigena TaxID=1531966 RepID=A0A0A1ST61_9HYPO|nr:Putative Transcription factor, fork head [[Torrubiella] hemipterigena]